MITSSSGVGSGSGSRSVSNPLTGAMSEINIELRDGVQAFPSLVYSDYVIWGLTYRILTQFLSVTDQTASG